jgi:hypothetical protein
MLRHPKERSSIVAIISALSLTIAWNVTNFHCIFFQYLIQPKGMCNIRSWKVQCLLLQVSYVDLLLSVLIEVIGSFVGHAMRCVSLLSPITPSNNANQMLLRTCALRSKPCFAVPLPSLAYRRLPAQASSLRFTSRSHLLAGYATSTNPTTANKANSLPLDASKLSDPGSGNKDSFEQQQIPRDSLVQETASGQQQPPSSDIPLPPPVTRENIYTIPNALTVSRIISCPFLGYFIINGNFVYATSLLFYAGVSDLVC